MTAIEVLPDDESQQRANATALHWPRTAANGSQVICNLGWNLDLLGPVSIPAADLVRIAASAYIADRHVRRPSAFSRTIDLIARVVDPAPWKSDAGDLLVRLLAWLTGDNWSLQVIASPAKGQASRSLPPADDVMLLSGGMDSLCGATDHLKDGAARIHLSHSDGSTAIRRAQVAANTWLQSQIDYSLRHRNVKLHQKGPARDASSRSRSLLFAALAVAVADTASSPRVTVPENGFTSINPPLTAARGGALSTRSTHPGTFARVNELLARLNIRITVANPYAYLTKGELLDRAIETGGGNVISAAAATLSCAKLDGGRYPGGNSNLNCGLCVACMVRRGAFNSEQYPDPTPYLVNSLTGTSRDRLLKHRNKDVFDIQQAILNGIDDTDVLSVGELPLETDIDAVIDLCQRGLLELNRVPLP